MQSGPAEGCQETRIPWSSAAPVPPLDFRRRKSPDTGVQPLATCMMPFKTRADSIMHGGGNLHVSAPATPFAFIEHLER